MALPQRTEVYLQSLSSPPPKAKYGWKDFLKKFGLGPFLAAACVTVVLGVQYGFFSNVKSKPLQSAIFFSTILCGMVGSVSLYLYLSSKYPELAAPIAIAVSVLMIVVYTYSYSHPEDTLESSDYVDLTPERSDFTQAAPVVKAVGLGPLVVGTEAVTAETLRLAAMKEDAEYKDLTQEIKTLKAKIVSTKVDAEGDLSVKDISSLEGLISQLQKAQDGIVSKQQDYQEREFVATPVVYQPSNASFVDSGITVKSTDGKKTYYRFVATFSRDSKAKTSKVISIERSMDNENWSNLSKSTYTYDTVWKPSGTEKSDWDILGDGSARWSNGEIEVMSAVDLSHPGRKKGYVNYTVSKKTDLTEAVAPKVVARIILTVSQPKQTKESYQEVIEKYV